MRLLSNMTARAVVISIRDFGRPDRARTRCIMNMATFLLHIYCLIRESRRDGVPNASIVPQEFAKNQDRAIDAASRRSSRHHRCVRRGQAAFGLLCCTGRADKCDALRAHRRVCFGSFGPLASSPGGDGVPQNRPLGLMTPTVRGQARGGRRASDHLGWPRAQRV